MNGIFASAALLTEFALYGGATVHLTATIFLFLAATTMWSWVVIGNGAEWLEGSFLSGVFIHPLAPRWPAAGIRVAGTLLWLGALGWFVLRLSYPVLRP